MAQHTSSGAMYSTSDLIRMAQMEYFGQYSAVVGRAMMRLAFLEAENKKLREKVSSYENTADPQGQIIQNI